MINQLVNQKKIGDYFDNQIISPVLFQANYYIFVGYSFLNVGICCFSILSSDSNEEALVFFNLW